MRGSKNKEEKEKYLTKNHSFHFETIIFVRYVFSKSFVISLFNER